MALYHNIGGKQVLMTPAEEAEQLAKWAVGVTRKDQAASAVAAKQANKDAFKANNDNKPVTVGDLRQILEDAGVI